MQKQLSQWQLSQCKNTQRLAIWTGAWLLTLALVTFGPQFLWQKEGKITLVFIAINVVTGAGMIWANKVHLQGLDELQQKIQLQAMALSLGVGLVLGIAYSSLDVANIISTPAEISHLVMLMGLTYLLGTILGVRKYQ
jgi:hypothetical protein